jgi:chemotaxis protein MotC
MRRLVSLAVFATAWLLVTQATALAAGDHGGGESSGHAAAEAKAEAAPEGTAEAEGEAPPEPALWAEAPAVEMAKQPYILIRNLRIVQDQIAAGSVSAHEEQRRMLRELSQEMRALPVGAWDDVRNVRAAIFFVLSGGDPAVLKLVIGRSGTPHVERRLLKGALAYGEGRLVDALGMVHKMQAREIDPSLAGMLALIQGTLTAKKDPDRALPFFNEARLLSPGTLVEEAALRQQMMIIARNGDLEKFDLLASQYARRFPRSLFARSFRQQFFAGVARKNFKRAAEWISRTETELLRVPATERAGLYLAMAEESLKGGNIDIAKFAANRARALAAEGSRGQVRATLYEGAALVVSADFEKGVALLQSIDIPKLGLSDREIHKFALEVAGQVGRLPVAGADLPNEKPPEAVTRAEAVLAEVDAMLGGTAQ